MTIDCALVQPAGPGAPPAVPGGEPGTEAAAFAAVIDPLLAAETSAGLSDSAAAEPPGPGAQPAVSASSVIDPTLAAFAEASMGLLEMAPAGELSPTPIAKRVAGEKDVQPDVQRDDTDSDDDPADLSAVLPVALVAPIADPALPALPLPLAGASGSSTSISEGDAGSLDDDLDSELGSSMAGGVEARASMSSAPSMMSSAAVHTEPLSVAPANPASEEGAPAAGPTPPQIPVDATRLGSQPASTAPAVLDGAATTDETSAERAGAPPMVSPPDAAAVDTPLREAEGSARTAPARATPASLPAAKGSDAAPASPGPAREAVATAPSAQGPAKARHTYAGVPSSASRLANGLVAQLQSAHGTPASGARPTSDGAAQPSAAANAPVTVTVPVAEGAVQGMDEAAFSDTNGSGNSGQPGNSSTSAGSGPGVPAPAVSATGQPGWASWPAGQIPSSAVAILGHAAAADDPVVPQLVKALHVQLRNGVSEARVQLEPHHFGAVSVVLRVENGVVSAVVTAEQPAVRHWLETHEASLRSALSEQGLHLDRLRVEPDERQSGERASTGQEPPPRRRMPRKETATFELVA